MTELFASSDAANTSSVSAYRVLARKYRPATFAELIGQEAMVRTLTNAIAAGRLPHAWMLTGVRGVGKTTTARLIARALNCTGEDGKGGPTLAPCGVCDACRTIAEDRHVDVQELDAASRTGVDDIRDIIDGVRYGPVAARYKIYILDEVHMLSKNAFNALLKTLEEPPPHTKFIFATTEIRKVPVTVLSRCQRFDLRRIESALLAQHFANVAVKEEVKVEAEALKLIARAADGSVRDGLSLLDQAIARGNGVVNEADVKEMLGLADRGQSLALCRQLLRGDMRAALETFGVLMAVGGDPLQVLQDLAEQIHLLTRAQIIPDLAASPDLPEYDQRFLSDLADIKIPALTRVWQILLRGIGEVQGAQHPAEAAEMTLIRLTYAAELPLPADLVRQLRERVDNSAAAPKAPPPQGSGSRGRVALALAPMAMEPVVQVETATNPAPATFREMTALFMENREGALHAQLYNYVHPVRYEPGVLEIRLEAAASTNLVGRVSQCLVAWTGRRWMVSVVDAPGPVTLAEEDRRVEVDRNEKAKAHPLMQAVLLAFPGAKMASLKQKTIATLGATGDDEMVEPEMEALSGEGDET
ncbi:MAG: DNA polymerase III subunit gamma/tau [Alphaproteobacteria bacterium]|nr:DNA polymerase III subunit gamma/tau [Alphaproteobacteria bacterium]